MPSQSLEVPRKLLAPLVEQNLPKLVRKDLKEPYIPSA